MIRLRSLCFGSLYRGGLALNTIFTAALPQPRDCTSDDAPGFSAEADRWLRQVPATDQADWVVTVFAQLRSCDLAQVRMPWRPTG